MALKPCRECKKKVSTEAATCPSCGVPNPTQKKTTVKPWGTEPETSIAKSNDLKPDYTYARCGRSFCNSKFKILSVPIVLIETQTCQACGNILEKVSDKEASATIENRTSNRSVTSVQQNLIEKIWWGNETLGTIFWMYCILTVAVVSFISGLGLEAVGGIVLVIPGIVIIWSNTGLWRSSDKFKSAQLKINQSYGWATAAKVYVVINYIVTISQLGLQLQTMQPL